MSEKSKTCQLFTDYHLPLEDLLMEHNTNSSLHSNNNYSTDVFVSTLTEADQGSLKTDSFNLATLDQSRSSKTDSKGSSHGIHMSGFSINEFTIYTPSTNTLVLSGSISGTTASALSQYDISQLTRSMQSMAFYTVTSHSEVKPENAALLNLPPLPQRKRFALAAAAKKALADNQTANEPANGRDEIQHNDENKYNLQEKYIASISPRWAQCDYATFNSDHSKLLDLINVQPKTIRSLSHIKSKDLFNSFRRYRHRHLLKKVIKRLHKGNNQYQKKKAGKVRRAKKTLSIRFRSTTYYRNICKKYL